MGEASRSRSGVVGELYVGGSGVARGYVANPRRRPSGSCRTRTARPDRECTRRATERAGAREALSSCWGERDGQVKVRGFRVELAEVEAAIGSCPGVREAAVIAEEDGADGQRLIACVVAEDDQSIPCRLAPTLASRHAPAPDDPVAISDRRLPCRELLPARSIVEACWNRCPRDSRRPRQSCGLATRSRNSSWRSGKTCSRSGRSA